MCLAGETDSILEMVEKGVIDLNPEYQRDVVWDDGRASALVGSFLMGFYVPPVIFNVVVGADGQKSYICVDGKQRITSICKFMNGEISVKDRNGEKWWYTNNGKGKKKVLPPKTKAVFKETPLVCYEYHGLNAIVEEAMFQLVQRGLPLTPAEKMRALSTPFANLTKSYEKDYATILSVTSDKRAAGFRLMLTMMAQIMENDQWLHGGCAIGTHPKLMNSPVQLTKILKADGFLTDDLKFLFETVLARYVQIMNQTLGRDGKPKKDTVFYGNPKEFHDSNRPKLYKPVGTFSPLEIVATAVLIQLYPEKTDAFLMGDLLELRIHLRQKHMDLRLNGNCWDTAWKFLWEELPHIRGGGEPGKMSWKTTVAKKALNRKLDAATAPRPARKPAAPVREESPLFPPSDDDDDDEPMADADADADASTSRFPQPSNVGLPDESDGSAEPDVKPEPREVKADVPHIGGLRIEPRKRMTSGSANSTPATKRRK